MKTFDHEWILEAFAGRSTFFTKRMFGGLAAYLHERLMLVLVEPTKTGRWKWHGVLIGTEHEHHASIRADFPALAVKVKQVVQSVADSTAVDSSGPCVDVADCSTAARA